MLRERRRKRKEKEAQRGRKPRPRLALKARPAPEGLAPRLALLGIGAAGAALCALRPDLPPVPPGLLLLFGATLCVYAVMLAVAWYPLPGVARGVESFFENMIDKQQSGWYLAVGLGHFALAEVRSLLSQGVEHVSLQGLLIGWLKSLVMNFSLQSFMNALQASLWPIIEIERHGLTATAIFAALVWTLYQVGARTLGELALGEEEEEEEPEAGDVAAAQPARDAEAPGVSNAGGPSPA